jgi:hypothetical protein
MARTTGNKSKASEEKGSGDYEGGLKAFADAMRDPKKMRAALRHPIAAQLMDQLGSDALERISAVVQKGHGCCQKNPGGH